MPESVGQARSFVRAVVTARAPDCPANVRDAIDLGVSELMTNSVQHSQSGQPEGRVTVMVHIKDTTARVGVADSGPAAKPPRADDAEIPDGGWGLPLVAAHATRMGRFTWFVCEWGPAP